MLAENHVMGVLSKIFTITKIIQKDSHNVIFLCTKITLWEFFGTKMKHHVMRNHVVGNHVSRGTAVKPKE